MEETGWDYGSYLSFTRFVFNDNFSFFVAIIFACLWWCLLVDGTSIQALFTVPGLEYNSI